MDLFELHTPTALDGALVIGAYLLGAIPFGLLLARVLAGADVRAAGSGNIGATNVARVAGKKLGAVTLLLDAIKGLTPVWVARGLGVQDGWLGLVALAAVLGHCYPVYLRFQGGKGVATGLGVFIALSPLAGGIGALSYLGMFAATRTSSLGSFALLGGTLITSALLAPPWWPLFSVIAIAAVILLRHRDNIRRLLGGKEHSF
ncbi:MAG: glycerol-3-phosphate 1-O-acyltransferase PlsY [Pseudomonadota bacterium]